MLSLLKSLIFISYLLSPHRIFIEIKCFLKGKNIAKALNRSGEHYCIIKLPPKRSQKNVKAKKKENLFKLFVVMLAEPSKHLPARSQ